MHEAAEAIAAEQEACREALAGIDVETLSMLLSFHLLATAGAIFARQSAYSMTIAGIAWGMLLLDEALSASAWLDLAIVLVGVYLVEPKSASEDIRLTRPLGRRRRRAWMRSSGSRDER